MKTSPDCDGTFVGSEMLINLISFFVFTHSVVGADASSWQLWKSFRHFTAVIGKFFTFDPSEK